MLQNIVLQAGEPPVPTGNYKEDYFKQYEWNRRLLEALERTLDQIDIKIGGNKNG